MKVQDNSAHQSADLPVYAGQSDQIFRQLMNILPVAVYTCDKNGFITYFNRSAAELWGKEPEIGKDLWCGSYKVFNTEGDPIPFDKCPGQSLKRL